MTIATFDYPTWALRYPELAEPRGVITAPLGQMLFDEAGLYLDNTDCSPVTDVSRRTLLLNMITAHLAYMQFGRDGQSNASMEGLVGRVSGAGEGSVSVSTDYGAVSANAAWWLQSPYGARYWQATAGMRLARYVPGRPPSSSLTGLWRGGRRNPTPGAW